MSENILSRAGKAVSIAKAALPYITVGPPLIEKVPGGLLKIDVPLLYNGFAIDRVHFNPVTMTPSPKGLPLRVYSEPPTPSAVTRAMEAVISELRVLEAAEYREPETAWAIPLAWKTLLIAHLKIRDTTWEIVPDYPLTEELRRRLS